MSPLYTNSYEAGTVKYAEQPEPLHDHKPSSFFKFSTVWTNDMFRMKSHDINQPITVICKICDVVVVVGVIGGVVVVVGTASV